MSMGRVWKVLALIPRPGGGDPLREYYFVAIDDQAEALEALQNSEPDLYGAKLLINGETTLEAVEWTDIGQGDIFCFMKVS
jgi:hypothetical protein